MKNTHSKFSTTPRRLRRTGRALGLLLVGAACAALTTCSSGTQHEAQSLRVEFDPVTGLTTRRHPVPRESLPLPLGARVVLRGSAKGVTDFAWTGATEISDGRGTSAAVFDAKRVGRHRVRVVARDGRKREIAIEVHETRAADIRLTITSGARPGVHYGGELECRCTTHPRAFERIVEWKAQGMSPQFGFGPRFRARAPKKGGRPGKLQGPAGTGQGGGQQLGASPTIGQGLRIAAGIGNRVVATPIRPVLYTVKWVRKPSKRDYFAATPTIRLYHEIRTEPAGYEDQVPWSYDTTGTGIATMSRTRGRSVTITRTNDRWHRLLCWRVQAGDISDSGDEINRLLSTPLQGREDQPPKNRDCGPPDPAAHSLPITLSNGEATLAATDLKVPSRGFDFVWRRSYSSRANFRGALGWNWSLNYDRRVYRTRGSTSVTVANGAEREDSYVRGSGNSYVSAAGYYDSLIENNDGTFVQIDKHGTRFDYDSQGHLVAITDRTTKNRLTLLRNSFGNVIEIVDTQDRRYTITYTDNTASQLIRAITDFRGRSVVYGYDRDWNLVSVRSPIVVGTPTNNDFSQGKTTLYSYTRGFRDNRLNHNLLSVVRPLYNVGNDVSRSKAIATLTYANTQDPRADDFDHVVAERWGHDMGGPPSRPNLKVGGTATFVFTRKLGGDTRAPSTAVKRTTETTRNGNVRIHYFDLGMREVRTIEETNRNVRPGEGDYVTDYRYDDEGLLLETRHPRGNVTRRLYDRSNPLRRSQRNLIEVRQQVGAVGGGLADLVTRFTYDPVFNLPRTVSDPRAFPTGRVPLTSGGKLDLSNALVKRYTITTIYDYQEGTGFQAGRGIPASERIPEGLGDQNGAQDFDAGNVVKINRPTIQTDGPNKGQTIFEIRTWNDRGQPLTRRDPEGKVRAFEYYASNNNANDPSDLEGYAKSVTEDAGGLGLKSTFVYDTSGNLTAKVDPKGQRSDFVVNELNQVVREFSRPVKSGGFRYRVDTIFDANDNVVRRETLNLDETGTAYSNASITHRYEYDIVHEIVASERERTRNDGSQAGFARTEFFYDAQTNRIAVKRPTPRLATRSATIITTRFDERELPYKLTIGDNDTNPDNTPPSSAVVVTTNYDANRNVLEKIDTIKQSQRGGPTPRFPGSASGDVMQHVYDGFDRRTRTTDGEGNVRSMTYDRVSNVTSTRLVGPIDHGGSSPRRTLLQSTSVFDELSRLVTREQLHVDENGAAVGDGKSTTTWTYDREGKILRQVDDRGNSIWTTWDGADRRTQIRDRLNNTTDYSYDKNSNVVREVVSDRSTSLSSSVDVYTTQYFYDGVDRVIRTIDPAGGVVETGYDARNNAVLRSDAVRGSGNKGNILRYDYDGLDRIVTAVRELTANGRGDGQVTGRIRTTQTWDDDSLLTGRSDDNGHGTRYAYDGLGRLIETTFGNGTKRSQSYNTDNQVVAWTDQNGTTCTLTYDGLARTVERRANRATGVLGATVERIGYDGASRTTIVQSDDIFSSTLMNCVFRYDSLSNRVFDGQGALSVLSSYDGVSNRLSCSYPASFFGSGRRTLTMTYDALNRQQTTSDPSGLIVTHAYKGPTRLERRSYRFGQTAVSRLDCAYDAFPRLIELEHRALSQTTAFAGFHYGYDREHHRLFEKRLHESNRGDVYAYDSIYRLASNLEKVDLSSVSSGTRIDPSKFSSPDSLAWSYDGVGNRRQAVRRVGGNATTTTYTQASGDRQVNQYTTVGSKTLRYDRNGNLLSDGSREYSYDFKNRLVEVRDASTKRVIARYSYDPLQRRAKKVVDPTGTTPKTTVYVYDDDKCVEERDGQNRLIRQFVWGPGTDELCQVQNGRLATQTFYAHENASGNVAALVNGAGTVVERYSYDPFGKTSVTLNGNTGNEHRYHSARFEPETGLYWMRARHYSPELGRFLQRDPIGIWEDRVNLGNGYSFVGNDAINERDPTGLESETWAWVKGFVSGFVGGVAHDVKCMGKRAIHIAKQPLLWTTDIAGLAFSDSYEVQSDLGRFQRDMMMEGASIDETMFEGAIFGLKQTPEIALTWWGAGSAVRGAANSRLADRAVGSFRRMTSRGEVALDANTLINALDFHGMNALRRQLGGRTPVISPTAAKEYLRGGPGKGNWFGNKEKLRRFIERSGGRLGPNARESYARSLRGIARERNLRGVHGAPLLKHADSRVAASANQDMVPLITNDDKLHKVMSGLGMLVERFIF